MQFRYWGANNCGYKCTYVVHPCSNIHTCIYRSYTYVVHPCIYIHTYIDATRTWCIHASTDIHISMVHYVVHPCINIDTYIDAIHKCCIHASTYIQYIDAQNCNFVYEESALLPIPQINLCSQFRQYKCT